MYNNFFYKTFNLLQEPVPIKGWPGTIVTTDKYPNSCSKVAQSAIAHMTNVTYSEDCLYLNIFTPGIFLLQNPIWFQNNFFYQQFYTELKGMQN